LAAPPQPGRTCQECGAPLRPDQRYCVTCGARIGGRSPLLSRLLLRLHYAGTAATAGAGGAHKRKAPKAAAGITPPPLRVWAVLTAAFLGFGVVVGAAASSGVRDRLAASSRAPLRVVLPAPPPAPGASAGSAAGGEAVSPAGGGEASVAEAQAASPVARRKRKAKQHAAAAPATSPTTSSAAETESEGSQPTASSQPSAGGHATKLPPVKHVFLITLSDQPYAAVFGPASAAPYLANSLEHQGELLVRYYAVAHGDLPNEVALVSGEGPTPQTALNCPAYGDIAQAGSGGAVPAGASGCVYPASVSTLAGQLAAKHLTWRAYVEGLQEEGRGACAHPAAGAADPTALPSAAQPYATFRDPFVYFHSVADSAACQRNDVGIGHLAGDLASVARTPSFAYIVPGRCHDASAAPCAPGAPAGLPGAETFLRRIVPEILASQAYKHGGLLVITVDQAPSQGEFADSSSCCGQPVFPDLPPASALAATAGGGQVGALLLSPFVKRATSSQEPYNHFSLLRTIEDLFGLAHLGYAGAAHVTALERSVFSAYSG
jgi:phosphatidylinositol-3-phosphatase